ncbi:probable glutathione S-transferase [Camellia sinensis]|uniref:probable glutathione S-transferase n=1 Tax=Camellia sinensis TaxID=4442 RepID=UPI001035A266|nr:probable glutathione S-transferase [Camellia sinensis]
MTYFQLPLGFFPINTRSNLLTLAFKQTPEIQFAKHTFNLRYHINGDELNLLGSWVSLPTARVRIAFAEKGVTDYESREEDLINKSPLLFKLNHVHKLIPVLNHNGKPLFESLIIVEYINEVWNHKSPLLPSDPHHQSHARFWANYVDKKIYSLVRPLFLSTGKAKEEAKNDLVGCFKVLGGELGDKPYFGGEIFGIVDVALNQFYSFFYTFEQNGNFGMVAECPKLVRAHRCLKKDSLSKALPS